MGKIVNRWRTELPWVTNRSRWGSNGAKTNVNLSSRFIGAGDVYTVEFWFWMANFGGWQELICIDGNHWTDRSNSGVILLVSSSQYALMLGTNDIHPRPNHRLNMNVWNHIAFTRDNNQWALFTNGKKVWSGTISNPQQWYFCRIGGNQVNPWRGFNGGVISDLRISNIVRYTDDFTPPTSAFVVDSDTITLASLNQTGSNPPVNELPALEVNAIPQDHEVARSRNVISPFINSTSTRDFFNKDIQNAFIQGKAIRNGQPLKKTHILLRDKTPEENEVIYYTGDNGEFTFHRLPNASFQVIGTPENEVQHNALVWDQVIPTSYEIGTSGRFRINTAEGKVDSDVLISSGFGPFEVELVSGEIPPNTTFNVEDRKITLDGQTSFYKPSYTFDLKITSKSPDYTDPKVVRFVMTA